MAILAGIAADPTGTLVYWTIIGTVLLLFGKVIQGFSRSAKGTGGFLHGGGSGSSEGEASSAPQQHTRQHTPTESPGEREAPPPEANVSGLADTIQELQKNKINKQANLTFADGTYRGLKTRLNRIDAVLAKIEAGQVQGANHQAVKENATQMRALIAGIKGGDARASALTFGQFNEMIDQYSAQLSQVQGEQEQVAA